MATLAGEVVCYAKEVWETAIEWDSSQIFLLNYL